MRSPCTKATINHKLEKTREQPKMKIKKYNYFFKKKSGTDDRKIVEDYGSPMKSCLMAFWKRKLKHYKEEISVAHTSPIH